mgnify:CR=1 FL=1
MAKAAFQNPIFQDEAKAREVWRWWEAQAADHTVAHPSRGGKRAVQPYGTPSLDNSAP